MPDDERYCSNCRTLIPPRAEVCPSCGVFAGTMFDGRPPKTSGQRAAGGGQGWGWVLLLFVIGVVSLTVAMHNVRFLL